MLAGLICVVLIAACVVSASPSTTSEPLPLPPPVGTPSSEPVSEGVHRFHPASAPLEAGQPYAYRLYTHCWETMRIDLDGSHWAVDEITDLDGAIPLVYGDPFDDGVVVIHADDRSRATYRSNLGDMALALRRLDGPVGVPLCA